MRIAPDMTALVGKTPLVRLHRVVPQDGAEVIAKLEFFNPASSVKDRIAMGMIRDAEKAGRLTPGRSPAQVIVEPTSGNTGIGLAFAAAVKGYKLILTMPESMSEERKTMLRGLGATLILTPAAGGMSAAVAEAEKIVKETPGAVMLGQFDNPANPATHYSSTAEEIWDDTDGTVDVFVSAAGTGGTVTGVGKRLKELNAKIRVYAVEPAESPVLSGGAAGKHGIQGIGAGFVPKVLDRSVLDGVLTVTTDEALDFARRLIREEGILCGISSGAAGLAAARLAADPALRGKRIVFIVCDTAERYLSTRLFTDE
ncbi:cysteine synthase A, O-acetylserine sulfhydrolase A subunit [uncultured delta proteobacterium]|uniref:Cysteine synthase n=1 Tax=uncultured delta proteobacterium TaxID=34034 RepID=A0A212JGS1_9DELT|nr:cysteine synthase A, O-acetylserine sulfhydrolase A subunit [uncultured delta proteobacterium]